MSTGLIPAGAGQTRMSTTYGPWQRAHPRGCGADWGTQRDNMLDMGLIPAGAGQT